ncbi:bacterial SH3 domain protein [Asticcacaulis biprosthecium C19]|uniref:Bacterial SH3 domain protein n=1 Tax=Asticcacaulis biprosthecium C19 TaxID=715226 RepID=F4QLG8_9CAUL|nr:SH3 domain-containing protein [Asticcacaulis biprosthecium]EGF92313.1 bacterial SH3 domain protein [Asticcacaulis biprosthecium C19]
MFDNRRPDINALTQSVQALPDRFCHAAAAFALLAMLAVPAQAADPVEYDTPSKAVVPRWAMLGKNEVNARNGPSLDNRKVWTYRKAGVPVQIISETRDWRLICDPAGGVAWVKKSMLRSPRNVITPTQKLEIRTDPKADADVRAIVRPRSIATIETCKDDWCKISVAGQTGWAPKTVLWGTQTTAVCARPNPLAER